MPKTNTIEVIDLRMPDTVEMEVGSFETYAPTIGPYGVAVYLAWDLWRRRRKAPNVWRLAKDTGMTEAQVWQGLAALEGNGLAVILLDDQGFLQGRLESL